MGIKFGKTSFGMTVIQVSLPTINISGSFWQEVQKGFYWTVSWPLHGAFEGASIRFINSLN